MSGKTAKTTMVNLSEEQKSLLRQLGILDLGTSTVDVDRLLTIILQISVEQQEEIKVLKEQVQILLNGDSHD